MGQSSLLIPLITLIFFLFAFTHASSTLGWRRATALLAIGYTVTMIFELLGVSTGFPFGPYHYSGLLGYKLLGLVPVLIPVAWFMMLYSSRTVALTLLGQSEDRMQATGTSSLFFVWVVSALAMVAWDLIMDPMMVAYGYWTWDQPGLYFGIPVSNFLGWFLVALLVYIFFDLFSRRWELARHPSGGVLYGFLPIGAYIATWLETTSRNLRLNQSGVAAVGFFTMGLLAMFSCIVYFTSARWESTGTYMPRERLPGSAG